MTEITKKSETITLEKATIWKIATAILAILFLYVLLSKTGGTAPAPTDGGDQFPTVNVDMKKLADDDAFLGNANAPVTIVEFSDYQCPYCGRHFADTHPKLIANYVNTGKVRIVFRDFPLSFHPNAQPAAEAAECAGDQGKYFEFHDKVFENQDSMSAENYKKWAVELGLNAVEFNNCVDTRKYQSEVQADFAAGGAIGVQGTPGFFIGKTNGNSAQNIAGAYPYDAFVQLIEAALK